MTRVFVYGTLKRDGVAHHLFDHGASRFVGEARTGPFYHLYDLGRFPGVVAGDEPVGSGVAGEVYECNAATIEMLDTYECVATGLFRRAEIAMSDGSRADAYLFADTSHARLRGRRLDSGYWDNTAP